MKRSNAEILISSDEEIGIKREPYSPEIKPGRLPCDNNSDDIDEKMTFSTSAKRKKIDQTSANLIQVEVTYFFLSHCSKSGQVGILRAIKSSEELKES